MRPTIRPIAAALTAIGALLVAPVSLGAPNSASPPSTASLIAVVEQLATVSGRTTAISVYVAAGPRFQGADVELAVAPGARILVDDRRLFPFDARSLCSLLLLTVALQPDPTVLHGELVSHENQCLRTALRAGTAISPAQARGELDQHRRWVHAKRRSEAARSRRAASTERSRQ